MSTLISYSRSPYSEFPSDAGPIFSFFESDSNIDRQTVHSFGDEWEKFNKFDQAELDRVSRQYFDILPASIYQPTTKVLDVGCGSGRWAYLLADRVGTVDAIDPSHAVFTAAKFLRSKENTRVTHAGVDSIPFPDNTFDLVMSIGVLHHVPDTREAIKKCVAKVKKLGYFYVYLYYDFEDRSFLFKSIFLVSHLLRKVICRLPKSIKHAVTDVIALTVYLPLARFIAMLQKIGVPGSLARKIPLSFYSDKSFYIMRNDALDRFGTKLEQRFSRKDITEMLKDAGLSDIVISDQEPYWHAVGQKL